MYCVICVIWYIIIYICISVQNASELKCMWQSILSHAWMRADECNNSFLLLAITRDVERPPLCDDTRGFATSPKLVTTTPVRCLLRPLRALCFCFLSNMASKTPVLAVSFSFYLSLEFYFLLLHCEAALLEPSIKMIMGKTWVLSPRH